MISAFLLASFIFWFAFHFGYGLFLRGEEWYKAHAGTMPGTLFLAFVILGSPFILVAGFIVAAFEAIVYDVLYNWTWGSLLYLQLPKAWNETFSQRVCRERKNKQVVRRTVRRDDRPTMTVVKNIPSFEGLPSYRRQLSEWIFQTFLKPVDPNHCGD